MDGRFETFLTAKNDLIDNAAYQLACAIAAKEADPGEKALEWDMSYIGEIIDAAEQILKGHGLRHCYPFYEGGDRTPCYRGKDCAAVQDSFGPPMPPLPTVETGVFIRGSTLPERWTAAHIWRTIPKLGRCWNEACQPLPPQNRRLGWVHFRG